MAELTEESKKYVKYLQANTKTDPKDVFKLLENLKQEIEASRLALKRARTAIKPRK